MEVGNQTDWKDKGEEFGLVVDVEIEVEIEGMHMPRQQTSGALGLRCHVDGQPVRLSNSTSNSISSTS
ncbi:hypothetical protein TWF217_008500 [Orbilia oligospora]|nr:hypothetical protein TWF128_010264 [Orbilia oligospora]KAF3250891.1 hypothetical protein TWF217_008500 [Orbilia oligospora]